MYHWHGWKLKTIFPPRPNHEIFALLNKIEGNSCERGVVRQHKTSRYVNLPQWLRQRTNISDPSRKSFVKLQRNPLERGRAAPWRGGSFTAGRRRGWEGMGEPPAPPAIDSRNWNRNRSHTLSTQLLHYDQLRKRTQKIQKIWLLVGSAQNQLLSEAQLHVSRSGYWTQKLLWHDDGVEDEGY